jgi:hypothetical protein
MVPCAAATRRCDPIHSGSQQDDGRCGVMICYIPFTDAPMPYDPN